MECSHDLTYNIIHDHLNVGKVCARREFKNKSKNIFNIRLVAPTFTCLVRKKIHLNDKRLAYDKEVTNKVRMWQSQQTKYFYVVNFDRPIKR